MKYYNLPTSQQIADYHSGQLSLEKNQWIEKLMNSNPFVKSAVEEFPLDHQQEVQNISDRISGEINRSYLQKRGFWSRFGSWISLSMVLILIGILALLNRAPNNKYTQEGFLLASEQEMPLTSEQNEVAELTHPKEPITAKTTTNTEKLIAENENFKNATPLNSEAQPETEQENMDPSKAMEPIANIDSDSEKKEVTKPSGKLLKSVRSVNLVSKDFDNAFKRSLPEYPGGDRALFDFFRTQLTPVELDYSESTFDAAVLFHLTVKKEGVEATYEIEGALHPIHQNQLENCVTNLPRFKPGQSDVTYTLQIAFN